MGTRVAGLGTMATFIARRNERYARRGTNLRTFHEWGMGNERVASDRDR